MKIDSIVVLENHLRYIILNDVVYNGKIYYFGMKVDEDNNIFEHEIKFFNAKEINGNLFIKEEKKEIILVELINILKNT